MNKEARKRLEKAIFGEKGMESRFKLPVGFADALSSKEYQVLSKRFGLDNGITRTLEDVGKDFGVTKERIRQIESVALEKIRHRIDIETNRPVRDIGEASLQKRIMKGLNVFKNIHKINKAEIKRMLKNSESLYKKFFTQLLKKAKGKTVLCAHFRSQRNFCAATRNGLMYSYVVKTRPNGGDGRIELYISQGNQATNKKRYDGFSENKKKIEKIFGDELNWRDLAKKDSPQVTHKSYIIDYIIPKLTFKEKNWPELQKKMIDAMSRLEKALRPLI